MKPHVTGRLVPALWAAIAAAVGASGSASAQTVVQLPEFHFFTVATTVSVPDRGAANLGGVSRYNSGSTSAGLPMAGKLPGVGPLFGSRGMGSAAESGGLSVRATIIDLHELDEAVLGAAAGASSGASLVDQKAARLAAGIDRRLPQAIERAVPAVDNLAASAAEIRRRNEAAESARREEATTFWQRGQKAELEGKPGAAKVFYEMAARRADGPLKDQVLARLEAIKAAAGIGKVVAAP